MCIVREKSLSIDDLAFLTASSANEAVEEAIQRSLSIHEDEADLIYPGPVALSQIVRR